MLHPSMELRTSRIAGTGLFATNAIEEGELIWRDDPDEPRFSVREIRSWPPGKRLRFYRYAYQVDDEWYAGCEEGRPYDPTYVMNHSCDPTTWFLDDHTGVARRRVETGEEITYDYATSEIDRTWRMKCRCGSTLCRGVISGRDYRLLDVQRRYGSHMMSHVLRAISNRRLRGRRSSDFARAPR